MQPLERLVNLVALLLESRRPLTFEEIREKLSEAYDHPDPNSAKRMFERDKDVLRDIGVPIEVTSRDVWDAEQGYTIPKDRYYLPEIEFTPEEITALVVAARSGGDASAEDAMRKLLSGAAQGILASAGPALAPVGDEPVPVLERVAEAVATGRRVRFAYRNARGEASEREVDAFGLAVRGGNWYLVGLDHGRREIRSFRLSRMGPDLEDVGPGSEPPDGFRAVEHVRGGPWADGEVRATAELAFAPSVAWWALRGVPGARAHGERDDGWVLARVPADPPAAIASWVLSFGPDAEALEPGELREEVVRRLESSLAR
jgi:proteasome accessory factor B